MKVDLPVEIVELILRLSLQESGLPEKDVRPKARSLSPSETVTASPSLSSQQLAPSAETGHPVTVSLLAKHYRNLFQPYLYRYVTLPTDRSIRFFARTVSSRLDLATQVRSLVILAPTSVLPPQAVDTEPASSSSATVQTAVGEILSACPSATHLLVDCRRVDSLPSRLYHLRRPKELSLVNVEQEHDLDGIVTRHRDLIAAALQNDPRLRSVLGGISTRTDRTRQPTETPPSSTIAPPAERSLSHLHLVRFDGRLLNRLVTLSSLRHLVLTHPHVPERRSGAPGLSILPRPHLMLLLGSGNIARIIIRAELATCIRIMEEIAPIEDRKLIFRPIRSKADLLFTDASQQSTKVAQLGTRAAALYDSISANELDLLAEFYNRVRRDASRSESSRSQNASSTDADTSRDSSGRSHGRGSDSSVGSGDGLSQSVSAGRVSGDEGETCPPLRQQRQDVGPLSDDYDSDDEEPFDRSPESHVPPPIRTVTNAPPLNIPIEELLRSERFHPAGLRTTSPPSSNASPQQPQRRPPMPLRQTPFSLRGTDLRGATADNIDLCTELFDALMSEAGGGRGETSARGEMSFW
ncbi:helicase C-terminal domain-containing protein-containing protein [Pseudozyma hubeiensis SY62]|uniref:Helicase C-terminal domain-containing protein-containing protein n=1 Tax=Pseudozyma hubeiensis (strain SY62) TaxID=1305764 RepID=R9PD50_PSEHS|nr:helicase C-terminal domain-containing protein-containing protein [Pseudozyma hubeiensis SY62]GAC99182.1 helicase C-terminal domain-containing protein-containing protein [Pseudozyma hubeiensis SY62]